MQIALAFLASMFGSVKRQDPFIANSETYEHHIYDGTSFGHLYSHGHDTHGRHMCTMYTHPHHFAAQKGGHKLRLPSTPQHSLKDKPAAQSSLHLLGESDSSAFSSNSSTSTSVANDVTVAFAAPTNMAPLSFFDPEVSKEWKGKMTVVSDDTSITYSTTEGGQITLSVQDNFVVVKTLKNMFLHIVTPGAIIRPLSEGDKLDYTVEPDHILFVNGTKDQTAFYNAQDSLHFYNLGVYKESTKLMPHSDWVDLLMDYVKIGLNPAWVKQNNYQKFTPTTNPKAQFHEYLQKDVDELAGYAMALLTSGTPRDPSPRNSVASMSAFFSKSDFPAATIFDYIKTISKVEDVSVPLYRYYQVNPAMLTIFAEVARRLYNLYIGKMMRDLFYGSCLGGNLLIYGDRGPTKDDIYKTSNVVADLIYLQEDFDYDQVQKDARGSMSFTTTLCLYINNNSPFTFWVWEGGDEIDKKYPLPEQAKLIFDLSKNYTYKTLYPVVKANFDVTVNMLPNVLHRLRAQVSRDTLNNWNVPELKRVYMHASASVLPRKAAVEAFQGSSVDSLVMTTLPRLCNDLGFTPQYDHSLYIASSFREVSESVRLQFARYLATKLTMENNDENVYQMLSWMPQYLSAYAYDNLNEAGINNKLSPGMNPWKDKPYFRELTILKSWLNADWPTGRSYFVSAFANDGEYGYDDPQWLQITSGNTAMSFGAIWPDLNPQDLNSIVTSGSETVAVQSNNDNTVTIYVAKCQTSRMIYHWHDTTKSCEFLVNTDWKPVSKTVKAEPNDFILVLDDPYESDKIAQWITDSMAGVEHLESKRFVMTGFMSKAADTLFMITTPPQQ